MQMQVTEGAAGAASVPPSDQQQLPDQ